MKIISPSYKRAKTVKTHKLIGNISYAVHEFEKEEYKKEGFDVIVLPDSTKGNIPNVRNWLLDQNFNNEILFIDDDIEKLMHKCFLNKYSSIGELIFLLDFAKQNEINLNDIEIKDLLNFMIYNLM